MARVYRQQAGDALDHHFARLVLGLPNQRDVRFRIARDRAHPFSAGAGLAGAAAAEDQPGGPIGATVGERRRDLVVMRENWKIGIQRLIPMALLSRHEVGKRQLVELR